MPSPVDGAFLVDAYSDPVILRIEGKASYLNSAPVGECFRRLIKQGRRDFVIDAGLCTGMDSTFLGLLAGAALEVRQASPAGTLLLCRLSDRNLELVRNLGLHRLLKVAASDESLRFGGDRAQKLVQEGAKPSEDETARMILKAHECLCDVDEGNRAKFQDVLTYLRQQVDLNRPRAS